MKKILLTLLIIFSNGTYSQGHSRAEIDRQIEEIIKAREEMFRSLLDDSGFGNFDKQFEDMVDKFQKGSFAPGTGMDTGAVIGEYDWRDTPTHQIFVLIVKQIKNKPLDIKIEKGQIKFRGDVESIDPEAELNKSSKKNKSTTTVHTTVHFERTFDIPQGLDETRPEFENKAGEILIKFKKFKAATKAPETDLKPIPPGPGDVTI